MRIRDLFTVPEGQKVTEKHLRRVLISSVCSILLCMSCLVGTTWAWFTVSIENTDNAIVIAKVTADVTIKTGEEVIPEPANGSYELQKGDYAVAVSLENDATKSDSFGNRTGTVYLVISVVKADETSAYYYIQTANNSEEIDLIINDDSATISFSVSWLKPAAADPIEENALSIGNAQTLSDDADATEQASESTEESNGETGESSEPESEPTEEAGPASTEEQPAEQPSESASVPSEEPSSEPTEPSSQPTSEPTESSSQPTEGNPPESTGEATTEPTEDTTETTAATSATDPSDETTEPVAESTAATGETEETTEPDQPQE